MQAAGRESGGLKVVDRTGRRPRSAAATQGRRPHYVPINAISMQAGTAETDETR